ncbi:MAG: transcriptional regulator, ArsR family [Firmicutes bacterium]|nr:transcriptional regulator, ArsR family [Bacillota bacterium]
MDIVEVLKSLGEPMRLRIINLLREDTLCVCDLEKVMNITQSNASRHLAVLRRARLIIGEKKAQWVYYSLDRNSIAKYPFLDELFAKELDKISHCLADRAKLKRYRELGGDCTHNINLEGE